ncbi:MAG: hypothetical protein WC506_02665 [Candidatus Micrarchaeia archaeon]
MRIPKTAAYVLPALVLLAGTGFAQSYCQIQDLSSLTLLTGLAALASAAMIALGFMLGQILQNPKILVWAKIEMGQLAVSAMIVILVVAGLNVFACNLAFSDVKQFTGINDASINSLGIPNNANLIDASKDYGRWLVGFNHDVLVKIRSNIGKIELRAAFSRWECGSDAGGFISCLVGGAGNSVAKYSGEYTISGMLGGLLNTVSAAYLSSIFILFTLEFLTSGLFAYFLPIGIMLRSVPFMRGFGGALIALVLVMYVGYPVMMMANLFLWYPSYSSMDVHAKLGTAPNELSPIGDNAVSALINGPPDIDPTPDLIFLSTTSFFVTMFLPAINFIVLAAAARSLSRMLGDEIDISRLAQMV